MGALFDFTRHHGALARAARAVLAAVRQADALAQRCDEHRLVGFYLKLPAALPEGYVICHSSIERKIKKSQVGARAVAARYNAPT